MDGSDLEGRLEVHYNGEWGTVCDDQFGATDASVVCSELGFSGRSEAVSLAPFGQGNGTILMDNVQCSGSEASLEQCSHNGWGSNNCNHREDVGVRCGLTDDTGKNSNNLKWLKWKGLYMIH